jgi:hypothetical protein
MVKCLNRRFAALNCPSPFKGGAAADLKAAGRFNHLISIGGESL